MVMMHTTGGGKQKITSWVQRGLEKWMTWRVRMMSTAISKGTWAGEVTHLTRQLSIALQASLLGAGRSAL